MKTIDKALDHFQLKYPMDRLCAPREALFLDIETTGFTARSSSLYLIGCAYYEQGTWHTRQWFAENPGEQAAILEEFFAFSRDRRFLIHFNGSQFD
ncbi:MAG: ribonuclease H-like domain-containing protein, partial [Lachnospiraceae bacterium]|nr:ribonuclease H-like domain-containing protein [Lachnospiraceae bacterium]